MKLYFLRHGAADWPDWNDDDDLRPLTENGKKELRRAAKFFKQIGVAPATIFASPLPRAAQTAQIVHRQIGSELHSEAKLSPGATPHAIKSLLKSQNDDLMIVGHEPDLSEIVRHFTGARVKMSKAGLARIDFEGSDQARLIWLVSPKISARKVKSGE